MKVELLRNVHMALEVVEYSRAFHYWMENTYNNTFLHYEHVLYNFGIDVCGHYYQILDLYKALSNMIVTHKTRIDYVN